MGIAFIVLVALCGIAGVCRGFVNRLLGFWLVFAYFVASFVLTPIVSAQQFVVNLIQDQLIRTIVVFVVLLFAMCMISAFIRWLFKHFFKRVKIFGFLNRLLGLVFDVAVVWGIFGALVALADVPMDLFVNVASPLAQFGADLPQTVAEGLYSMCQSAKTDEILTMVYGYGNPIGEFITNLLVTAYLPTV